MKSTELAELLLVRLHELAQVKGRFALHTLSDIAAEFGVTDKSQVFSVGNMLERRGLIYATFTQQTEVHASIKAEGELLVEQGGETGILRRYAQDPKSLVVIDQSTHFHHPVSHSNIAVHSTGITQFNIADVDRLLGQIRDAISGDVSLSPEAKQQAWADVELIRGEVARQAPREGILREALSTIGDITSISSFVAQLASLLFNS